MVLKFFALWTPISQKINPIGGPLNPYKTGSKWYNTLLLWSSLNPETLSMDPCLRTYEKEYTPIAHQNVMLLSWNRSNLTWQLNFTIPNTISLLSFASGLSYEIWKYCITHVSNTPIYMSQAIAGIRHFRKCLEFLQMPEQFREYFIISFFSNSGKVYTLTWEKLN